MESDKQMMQPKTVILAKMDSFDQLQSMNAAFREKLVYEIKVWDDKSKTVKTKYELTYIGIKQLVLELSQKGQGMQIIPGTNKVVRVSIDPANPKEDVWQAEIQYKNIQTGHETWGVSEAPVFPWENYPVIDMSTGKKQWNDGKLVTKYEQRYDLFGRTGAVAKATRNALRNQLPEMAIQLFVEEAMKKNPNVVQKVEDLAQEDMPEFCKCPDGPKTQLNGRCKECHNFSKVWWEQSRPK